MSRFKVGDKVRYKGASEPWFERHIEVDDEGTVVGKGYFDGDVCVSFGVADDIPIEDLEIVAPADKKREFLERLQSLMREFDAKIDFGGNDKGLGFIFSIGKDKVFIPYDVGTGEIDQYGFPKTKVEAITADNIIGFDKD